MARKKAFSEAALEEATDAAITGMRREAAALQLKGKNVNPHELANAEMSIISMFYEASSETEIFSRIRNSSLLRSGDEALKRAYNYGLSYGLGHLGIREENHPRVQAA